MLRDAYELGRLDEGEFEDRLEALHEARTYRDLATLVADVPHELPFLEPVVAPHRDLPSVAGPEAESRLARRGPGRVLRTVLIAYVVALVLSGAGAGVWMVGPLLVMVALVVAAIRLLSWAVREVRDEGDHAARSR